MATKPDDKSKSKPKTKDGGSKTKSTEKKKVDEKVRSYPMLALCP